MTWLHASDEWRFHDVEFAADLLDPARATGPWSGHRWFVYDLIRWQQPQLIVELGTHYGVSFFAMEQAVHELSTSALTKLVAVDSWAGDPHAGFYGNEVFSTFQHLHTSMFPSNSVEIRRQLFSEALSDFPDESIDLLHIDGFHSWEALQEDFSSWLPKLGPNGLVLIHDVDASSGYGSAKYFSEQIVPNYPTLKFAHSFGLGLVFPNGVDGWEFLFSKDFELYFALYAYKSQSDVFRRMSVDQTRMIDERDELIRNQDQLIAFRDSEILELRSKLQL